MVITRSSVIGCDKKREEVCNGVSLFSRVFTHFM